MLKLISGLALAAAPLLRNTRSGSTRREGIIRRACSRKCVTSKCS
jgi:hypothetical protein